MLIDSRGPVLAVHVDRQIMCLRPEFMKEQVSTNPCSGGLSSVVHLPSKNARASCGGEGVIGVDCPRATLEPIQIALTIIIAKFMVPTDACLFSGD